MASEIRHDILVTLSLSGSPTFIRKIQSSTQVQSQHILRSPTYFKTLFWRINNRRSKVGYRSEWYKSGENIIIS